MDPVVVQSSSAGFRSVYYFGDQETMLLTLSAGKRIPLRSQ